MAKQDKAVRKLRRELETLRAQVRGGAAIPTPSAAIFPVNRPAATSVRVANLPVIDTRTLKADLTRSLAITVGLLAVIVILTVTNLPTRLLGL